MKAEIGDKIKIINMNNVWAGDDYKDKEGIVTHIDSIGQLWGTWGGLAVIPGYDEFIVLQ